MNSSSSSRIIRSAAMAVVVIMMMLSMIITSSHANVQSYNTTLGCSMYGEIIQGNSITTPKNFTPSPINNGGFPPGVCPSHPEYNQMACCNYNQTLILSTSMLSAESIFGRCPACLANLWDLWCASGCSPYQAEFMIITGTKVVDGITAVASADYIIDPDYANQIYLSCRDIQSDGNLPFANEFPTYESFFNDLFGSLSPEFSINFIFNSTTGYKSNVPVVPCSESCSCESCRDLCFYPNELNGFKLINDSIIPNTYLFDKEVPVLSIWFILLYYLFLLTLFTSISMWYLRKMYRGSSKFLFVFSSLALLYVSGILFPIVSGITPSASSKCQYQMPYNEVWDCSLSIITFTYSLLVLVFFAILSIVLYFKNRKLSNRIASENNNNNGAKGYGSTFIKGSISQQQQSENDRFKDIGIEDPSIVQKAFYLLGRFVSRYPLIVVAGAIVFTVACGIGIKFLQIEEDPVKLWVSPDSRSAQEKDYFDSNFGPFYRIEQMIITPVTPPPAGQVIINFANLQELITLEWDLMQLTATYNDEEITLDQLCFQPTRRGCLVESVTGYWQRNLTNLEGNGDVASYFEGCIDTPLDPGCMDNVSAPVMPSVVLGGWSGMTNDSINAKAFITTFLLNNPNSLNDVAMAWEQVWLDYVEAYNKRPTRLFNIAYNAQRSVQDELSRESAADVPTILISYTVMFIYVSFALGKFYPFPSRIASVFVNSRFTLGLFGILVVAFSIAISVGICSYAGIKATLIISEVIPFLVLAIGVDNIFILVNTFESMYVSYFDQETRSTLRPSVDITLARAMAKVGPSMALSSLSESLAFILGTLTKMPAVVAFSYYAAVAIFFDFLLQITAFAALLSLDMKRSESRRIDCIPCVKLDDGDNSDDDEPEYLDEKKPLLENTGLLSSPSSASAITSVSTNSAYNISYRKKDGLLKLIFKRYYTPFLMNPVVKIVAVIIFLGMLLTGITLSFKLTLGLDQRVALPSDSYLQTYFNEMDQYLEVGPPFYIVVRGEYDYTGFAAQNQICTLGGCSNTSLLNVFNNAPFVHSGISSWLDDYISWSIDDGCCLIDPTTNEFCVAGTVGCIPCFNTTETGRPMARQFMQYLPEFFSFETNTYCSVTGLAYSADLNIQNNGTSIVASRFDGYHSTLKSQDDYINALKAAYYIADNTELDVFVYSVFYVYFEQYLNIRTIALMDIIYALCGVLFVSLILLTNPIIAFLVVICVAMVSIDLLGIMYLWNVNLNAVSTVNVVMAIGISIEFCVHIAHAFIRAPATMNKNEKAIYAVTEVGSSIISGIFITKLLGVVVLGFSNSEIFRVYYFRMYISIVILGALHGLVLLPILLSYFGSDRFNFRNLFKKEPKITFGEVDEE